MFAGDVPTSSTVMTYPEQLSVALGWMAEEEACQPIAKRRLDAFDASVSMTDPIYLTTDAYSDLELVPTAEQGAIDSAPGVKATVQVPWRTTAGTATQKVAVAGEPGITYVTEVIDGIYASTICISAYADRR